MFTFQWEEKLLARTQVYVFGHISILYVCTCVMHGTEMGAASTEAAVRLLCGVNFVYVCVYARASACVCVRVCTH